MTYRYYLIISFLLSLMVYGCQSTDQLSSWEIIYKNDRSGNTLMGSKQALINAIRQGLPIRIGWGHQGKTHTIEHISEPIWIEILDTSEVVVYLDPQIFSARDWETLSATYSDSTLLNQEWRVVLTTKGTFDAIWYDRASHRLLRRMPQNHTMSWFVKNYNPNKVVVPFFEE